MIAALQVFKVIIQNQMTLHELCSEIKLLPQVLVNFSFSGNKNVLQSDAIASLVKKVESTLAGRGRILLRTSGTEPVIRVMIEAEQEEHFIKTLAEEVAEKIKKSLY